MYMCRVESQLVDHGQGKGQVGESQSDCGGGGSNLSQGYSFLLSKVFFCLTGP
jgi:hypothetical protein